LFKDVQFVVHSFEKKKLIKTALPSLNSMA